jgi:hypothetical protein
MRPTKKAVARATFGLLLGTSAVIGVVTVAAARTRFDGVWSVSIVTERGNCERGYRAPVSIVNGVVEHGPSGDSSFSIAGRVVTSGAVRVSVRRGDQSAEGSGHLGAFTGQGRWVSPSSGCTGYWTAERREASASEQPRYRAQPGYEPYPQYRGYSYH